MSVRSQIRAWVERETRKVLTVQGLRLDKALEIPVLTGALEKSVRYGSGPEGWVHERIEDALANLSFPHGLSAGSTSEYWPTIDRGLHVGADGRLKGSKQAPQGISAPAAAALRRSTS